MQNKNFDQPFREDLGVDDLGYRRIRMGRTIYGAKDGQVFSLVNGAMTLVSAETLQAKAWIERNVNEVLGVKTFPFQAKVTYVLHDEYHITVNGTRYIACGITTDLTVGLDDGVVQSNYTHDRKPEFSFSELFIIDGKTRRQVLPDEVSNTAFQAAVKSALNFRRKSEYKRNLFAYQYSRNEARAHKQRRFNSTSV